MSGTSEVPQLPDPLCATRKSGEVGRFCCKTIFGAWTKNIFLAPRLRLDRIGNFDSQNRAIRILLLPNFPGRAAPRGLLQQYRPRTVVSLPGVPCSTRRATLPNP